MHLILLDLSRRSRAYASLLLPLSADGNRVDMMMAVDSKNQDPLELKDFFSQYSKRRV